MFRSPIREDDGSLGPAELLTDVPEVNGISNAHSRAKVPAIILLIVGMIGIGFDGLWILAYDKEPDLIRAKLLEMMDDAKAFPPDATPAEINQIIDVFVAIPKFCIVAAVLSVIGAICTLSRKFFPLAVIGALAGMVHIWAYTCLLGLPIGVWMLIVLFQPDVRRSFT